MKKSNSKPRLLRAIAILLGVFLLGSVFGASLTVATVKRKMQQVIQFEGPPPGVRRNYHLLSKRIATRLDLTATEAELVRRELATTMNRVAEIRFKTVEQVQAEITESIQRIGAQLPKDKGDQLKSASLRRLRPWGIDLPSQDAE